LGRLRNAAGRLAGSERRRHAVRLRLAHDHLHGDGVEIGALHQPLPVPMGTTVRYIDRMSVAGLREHYPELADLELVEIDVIDDGERLGTLADGSQDFVIANHFIEHTQDPIGTLANHLRVLRPGGILYLAVPDQRHTFDRDRPLTELDHLLRDHAEGPQWSRAGHFDEWARLVVALSGQAAVDRARELEAMDYSIHFHVWRPETFTELVLHCRDALDLPLEVEAMRRNGHEFVVVLRRSPA
jgi:SAM-dependent methyltransferase